MRCQRYRPQYRSHSRFRFLRRGRPALCRLGSVIRNPLVAAFGSREDTLKVDGRVSRALSLLASVNVAPRPGLEPGTCGLTVRPLIARKAAPVNDLGQNGR